MDAQAIREQLNGVFRRVFDDDALSVRDDMTAKDVENWDSLTHIDLIVAVEKVFGVKFTTREVHELANVGDLVKLIAEKKTG
jgi:acyl carrier protein